MVIPHHAISYDTCREVFKCVLSLIGEKPELYGEHSDRTGGLSAAGNADIPWVDAESHGRWKPGSIVPKSYFKRNLKKSKKVSLNLGL